MSPRFATAALEPTLWWIDAGTTKESQEFRSAFRDIRKRDSTVASYVWRESLRYQVEEVYHECSSEGWDGYDAEPIPLESRLNAIQFIGLLPDYILPPDVTADPTGMIAFEWRRDSQKHFSLSISGKSLVYAGIFGGSHKKYGEELFFAVIPATISRILTQYFLRT